MEERKKRVFEAVQLKEPDRVPCMSMFTFFPARYSGLTYEELMYDYDKLYTAAKRVIVDFEPEFWIISSSSGRATVSAPTARISLSKQSTCGLTNMIRSCLIQPILCSGSIFPEYAGP
jgi:hypothetical protein